MSEERLAEGAEIGAEDELDLSLRPRRLPAIPPLMWP